MKFINILDPERRSVFLSRIKKRFRRRSFDSAIPFMLLGAQRSGTSMLMDILELHPSTQVMTEVAQSPIYFDFRIRSIDVVDQCLRNARAPVVCFKPISDSHLASRFVEQFPQGRFVWIVRSYLDVAASSVKKFAHIDRAIRLVCKGEAGGGWFQEGVSEETVKILRALDHECLSVFDYACLVWWARNRIYVEQELNKYQNVTLVCYEKLLDGHLEHVFEFARLSFDKQYARFVKRPGESAKYPFVSPQVADLCQKLQLQLKGFTYSGR